MSQTTNGELPTRAARRAAGGGGPILNGDRLPTPPRQRRPLLAVLALVLILGGAALAATLVLTSGKKQEYLLIAHDIPLGQTLTADDFRQQALAATNSQTFAPVLVADFRGRVEGRKALKPLAKGSLLTEGTFGAAIVPAKGLVQISLNVPEGRFPKTLVPGDVVKVLYTPGNGSGGGTANGSGSGGTTGANPTLNPKAVPHAPTLIEHAYVDSIDASAAGQNGVVIGIEVKDEDITQTPADGLPAVTAANAQAAITVARYDPGHEHDEGTG